jgi:hypothetical protein
MDEEQTERGQGQFRWQSRSNREVFGIMYAHRISSNYAIRIDPSLSASLFLIDRKLSGTKMPNPLNLAQRVRKWRENYDG